MVKAELPYQVAAIRLVVEPAWSRARTSVVEAAQVSALVPEGVTVT
jgi:hypothetical protein